MNLPAAQDAERFILGMILLQPEHLAEAMEVLEPGDFFFDSHRKICSRIVEIQAAGGVPDVTVLANEMLKTPGELEGVGGVSYLASLTDGMPRRPNISAWVKIVKQKSDLRKIINIAEWAMQEAEAGTEVIEISGTIQESLLALHAKTSSKVRTLSDLLPEVMDELQAIRDRGDGLVGFTTGLQDLDHCTTGIRCGEYWVCGAAPSRGKTVLGTQIAFDNAEQGIPALVFSYEMSSKALVKRLMAQAGVGHAKPLRRPAYVGAPDWEVVRQKAGELQRRRLPLYIEDLDDPNIRAVISKAKLYIRRHGIKLIVVDYLQQINAPGKERRERVAEASNQLRRLAKSENVAMLALSQLRRPPNENDIPTLHDLKESGDIEGHAHTVLLNYRPKNADHSWSFEDKIFIAKQREGVTGPIDATLVETRLRWEGRS